MKKILIVISGTILLFSFGDRNQNSFSQQSGPVKSVRTLPSAVEIKKDSFRKDTINQNKLIKVAVDSLRAENYKTEVQIQTGKDIIKVQKKNENDLSEIRGILGKGLAENARVGRTLPDIMVIYGSKKAEPIPVEIDFVAPDTLPVPTIKRTFFQKLRFWRQH